ncbi:MAG: hypothetical protein JSV44_08645 [Candidatus Zixiibacteriota bacterium]|nr:MAG: hypothetical protein JSV44_08645 [candidate division Zixibacteria bacterium]
MLPDTEKTYYKALVALQNRDYVTASGYFRSAENLIAEDDDLRILKEATALLVAVKNEILELENSERNNGVDL